MPFEYAKILESVAATAAKNAQDVDRGGQFPSETLRQMGETGLLGLVSATEVGGKGLGLPAAAEVVQRIARECASTAMVVTMHYCATAIIEAHGPADVRKAIAAGKHLSTLAFSEVGTRSAFWVPVGTASVDGDQVKLTGRKSMATSATHADSYVWSSKPTTGGELSTLWLVPRTTPGIRTSQVPFDGLGLRGNDSSPIVAEDARVPVTARVGDDGAGFGIMMGIGMPWFNVMATAVSVGLMETAVARTAAHTGGTKFEHASQALAELPTIRAFVARMQIKADHNKLLLADTLAAMGANRPDMMLRVLESKAAASEAAAEVTDLAMRVCGGAAFRKDVGIERLFRDARAGLVMSPTPDILYDFIGKSVCGLPLF